MNRRYLAVLSLTTLLVACGTPVENAASTLVEQVRLGDPLAQTTYTENRELLESTEALPIWLDHLANDESPQVKKWAAQMLGNIGDPSALPALAAAMGSNRDVREAAIEAIKQFDEEAAAGAFAAALENESPDGQVAALAQLSRMETESPEAVTAVAEVASRGDGLISRTAVDTLGDMGTAEACAALAAVVTDSNLDTDLRAHAVDVLARLDSPDAATQIDAVVAALEGAEGDDAAALLERARGAR